MHNPPSLPNHYLGPAGYRLSQQTLIKPNKCFFGGGSERPQQVVVQAQSNHAEEKVYYKGEESETPIVHAIRERDPSKKTFCLFSKEKIVLFVIVFFLFSFPLNSRLCLPSGPAPVTDDET